MLLKTNDVFTILEPLDWGRWADTPDIETEGTLWVVTGTEMSGGGTGHGPHDVYPDGHGIHAAEVDAAGVPTGQKFFFRQSGCFTNLLTPKEVKVVGTATPAYNLQMQDRRSVWRSENPQGVKA